jgi:hypothetical protein
MGARISLMGMLGAEPARLLFFSPNILPIIPLNFIQQKLPERGIFDVFEKSSPKRSKVLLDLH